MAAPSGSSLPQVLRASAIILSLFLLTGCGKKEASNPAPAVTEQNTAPGPAPAPAQPTVVPAPDDGNMDALLAQLTRELHRTMIGRRINRNFEEFVALRNLQVPPPPAGKKYAINERWKVILVDK
jgi:hypothetical protein